eukprot:491379-Rhodomonas_salina.2
MRLPGGLRRGWRKIKLREKGKFTLDVCVLHCCIETAVQQHPGFEPVQAFRLGPGLTCCLYAYCLSARARAECTPYWSSCVVVVVLRCSRCVPVVCLVVVRSSRRGSRRCCRHCPGSPASPVPCTH